MSTASPLLRIDLDRLAVIVHLLDQREERPFSALLAVIAIAVSSPSGTSYGTSAVGQVWRDVPLPNKLTTQEGGGGEPACRRGSVAAARAGGWPSIYAAYLGTSGGQPVPRLALLRVGFTEPAGSPRSLVRSYRTVSPLPVPVDRPSAVCSLWHFPAGHPDWPLASTLPCGAPTFLDPARPVRRGHPADSPPAPFSHVAADMASAIPDPGRRRIFSGNAAGSAPPPVIVSIGRSKS